MRKPCMWEQRQDLLTAPNQRFSFNIQLCMIWVHWRQGTPLCGDFTAVRASWGVLDKHPWKSSFPRHYVPIRSIQPECGSVWEQTLSDMPKVSQGWVNIKLSGRLCSTQLERTLPESASKKVKAICPDINRIANRMRLKFVRSLPSPKRKQGLPFVSFFFISLQTVANQQGLYCFPIHNQLQYSMTISTGFMLQSCIKSHINNHISPESLGKMPVISLWLARSLELLLCICF